MVVREDYCTSVVVDAFPSEMLSAHPVLYGLGNATCDADLQELDPGRKKWLRGTNTVRAWLSKSILHNSCPPLPGLLNAEQVSHANIPPYPDNQPGHGRLRLVLQTALNPSNLPEQEIVLCGGQNVSFKTPFLSYAVSLPPRTAMNQGVDFDPASFFSWLGCYQVSRP